MYNVDSLWCNADAKILSAMSTISKKSKKIDTFLFTFIHDKSDYLYGTPSCEIKLVNWYNKDDKNYSQLNASRINLCYCYKALIGFIKC